MWGTGDDWPDIELTSDGEEDGVDVCDSEDVDSTVQLTS